MVTSIRNPERRVLIIGELLYDRDVVTNKATLGGAPANVASRLSELDIKVDFISRVGKDRAGRRALEKLTALGIDTQQLQTDHKYPTGVVDVTRLPSGDATYVIRTNMAYDHIECTSSLIATARKASAFYFGILAQRSRVTRDTTYRIIEELPKNSIRFLDINLRKRCFNRSTIIESLQRATHLKLNNDELRVLSRLGVCRGVTPIDKAMDLCRTYDIKYIYLTWGARGAMIIPRTGEVVASAGYKASPLIDTIGSGDAFSASVIADLINGGIPLQASVDQGCRIATMVAMQKGGFGKLPKGWRTYELERSLPVLPCSSERIHGIRLTQ